MKMISFLASATLALSSITGCTLMGHAGVTSHGSSASPAAASAPATQPDDGKVPAPLERMQEVRAKIEEMLNRYETGFKNGTSSDKSTISIVRVKVRDYFKYAIQGGVGACEPCKNHKLFPELAAAYTSMDDRTTALEKQYYQCTNGYKMSNGDMVKPSLTWSVDEYKDTQAKAVAFEQRCWPDKDLAKSR